MRCEENCLIRAPSKVLLTGVTGRSFGVGVMPKWRKPGGEEVEAGEEERESECLLSENDSDEAVVVMRDEEEAVRVPSDPDRLRRLRRFRRRASE